jgi:hypothetical protein
MQTFQFLLCKFWFEAPVLLREGTRDAFLPCLSSERAVVAVTALYLYQAHTSDLLLTEETNSMQDSANQSAQQQTLSFFWNKKEGS